MPRCCVWAVEVNGEGVEVERGFIANFINFLKPFDSLAWDVLWKIVECLG